MLGKGEVGPAALKCHGALRNRQQAGDHPQQGGLPRSVLACHRERLARRDIEIEPRKDISVAPHTAETLTRKPHD